eukprot:CAMPEP_0170641468 /NCGR_PEP_ID=MMETSP0224-20130122/40779_1 /TAXON_ID=285029 /ORGANISM="Togula jolla, Strain CCCM 725" /LENGTH=30 /DNA_ID= /DNA_START= /DNA_END= /DNA_ORIENTATION=
MSTDRAVQDMAGDSQDVHFPESPYEDGQRA